MPKHDKSAHRYAFIAVAAFAGLGVAATAASAAKGACDGVKVELTDARKREYAPLGASAMNGKVKPAHVEFSAIMESADWSAAYVSTPASDDGVMFFQKVGGKKRFREVWGGWAEPSERPELADWARKLGAPANLAKCFAEIVTADE